MQSVYLFRLPWSAGDRKAVEASVEASFKFHRGSRLTLLDIVGPRLPMRKLHSSLAVTLRKAQKKVLPMRRFTSLTRCSIVGSEVLSE